MNNKTEQKEKSILIHIAELIDSEYPNKDNHLDDFIDKFCLVANFQSTNKSNYDGLLIEGDNKDALEMLLRGSEKLNINSYKGTVDLIYIDPPYDSNNDYYITTKIESANKTYSIKNLGYIDKWTHGTIEYLTMLYSRLSLLKDLLSDKGSIFVHIDNHASNYVKILLDSIFGRNCFRNEIIWCYRQGGRAAKNFSKKHDTIFWYSKSPNQWIFNEDSVRIPYVGTGGYQTSGKGVTINGKTYKPHRKGKIPEDWWDIPSLPPMSMERIGFSTQKPEALLKRILLACSNKNSVVVDCFCGSGTTLSVAQKLKRRWIGVDFSKRAIQITQKRLLNNKLFSFKYISTNSDNICFFEISYSLKNLLNKEILKISIDRINFDNIDIDQDIDIEEYKMLDLNELIEMICVDIDYSGDNFNPQIVLTRKNHKEPINLGMLNIYLDKKENRNVNVRIVDIFGRCSQKNLIF